MIEKQVPGVKFDTDRTEAETTLYSMKYLITKKKIGVKHETSHIFTISKV